MNDGAQITEHRPLWMDMSGGIYKIVNTTNGKQYVGSAANLNRRQQEHWRMLKRRDHPNAHLQASWDKYGEEAFEFRIIGKCTQERLVELEQEVMDHLKPEYNLAPKAGSNLGTVWTAESRHKLSVANKGKKLSADTKRKMSEVRKGRKFSVEHKLKLSIASKGHKRRLGSKLSNETKRKIGEANKRRIISEKTRRKLSDANKGNKRALGYRHSEEAKHKMSEDRTGKSHSKEAKYNMSEAQKKRRNRENADK